jgi:cyclophilin family peptidyl-prolyl cis-trans isomerase
LNTNKLFKRLLVSALLSLWIPAAVSAEDNLPEYPQIAVETNVGNFTMELFTNRAPLTVQNFMNYLNSGFYNGVVFHRVVGDFVAQAGGYDFNYIKKSPAAEIPNESGNGLSNRRGFIAMARTADPHSADSQFFINLGDNLALDPRPTRWGYTVFGRVTEGMDTIDQIGYLMTGPGPAPELTKDVPVEPVIIKSMVLINSEVEQAPAAPELQITP